MFPNFTRSALFVFAAAGLMSLGLAETAEAQSVQSQCSTKYQAAKAANTLNGQSWRQYYSACAAELKAGAAGTQPAAAAPPPTATAPVEAPPPAASRSRKTATAPAEPETPALAPQPTGPIVFPTAISPEFSTLSAGQARRKTCGAQFKANKATNSNGGLKWSPKGGGYYTLCNNKLKG